MIQADACVHAGCDLLYVGSFVSVFPDYFSVNFVSVPHD